MGVAKATRPGLVQVTTAAAVVAPGTSVVAVAGAVTARAAHLAAATAAVAAATMPMARRLPQQALRRLDQLPQTAVTLTTRAALPWAVQRVQAALAMVLTAPMAALSLSGKKRGSHDCVCLN